MVLIEQANFDAFAERAVFEILFKKYYGETPDLAVFDALIKKLDAKLDAYEKILSKQKYLAGDELTLADLFHLPYGTMLATAGSNIMETKPNVARWFNSLTSRASWVSVKEDALKSTA
ncbi:hypothetical protein H0H93_009901 [Arthromyces matolae]|nr:hypothetical protein H0H93_009901 [Arthromyces matolae]